LEARADAQDGRVTRIFLTEGAHALHADVQRQRKALSALAVAGMEAEQKQQLLALLLQIKHNLEQQP
jgi:DNA-binding MarR family transcriptional regulator